MMRPVFIILLLLTSCTAEIKPMVLDYDDFGPQVLSYKTLGYGWYEWNSHGSQEKDNIKIVVYKRNKSFAEKKYKDSQSLPVVDYRFISYESALEYFNQNIKELARTNEFPEIIKQLKLTKKKLKQGFKTVH